MYRIDIGHNFETAHRLSTPGSPRKCMSIHGHSWWVRVEIEGRRTDDGDMLVEFGAFKKAWRGWLDTHLDHHLVLKEGDPMIEAVRSVYPESRIFVMERNPTTEAIAALLHQKASEVLGTLADPELGLRISHVHVQETRVNAASYREDA